MDKEGDDSCLVGSILNIALVGICAGQGTLVSLGLVGEAIMVWEDVHIYVMVRESSFFEKFWSGNFWSDKIHSPFMLVTITSNTQGYIKDIRVSKLYY